MTGRDGEGQMAPHPESAPRETETPEALFERIQRRRAEAAPVAAAAAGAPATVPGAARAVAAPATSHPAAQPVRVDEILAPSGSGPERIGPVGPGGEGASAPGVVADPAADKIGAGPASAGPFPRSATMRLLLKHPELALGVGLPAAGLILGFPKSRRLLGAAIRLGTRPDVQQALQLTSVLRQRGRRRSRSDPEAG